MKASIIRDKLKLIERRLAELDKMDLSDASYRSQELRAERRNLEAQRVQEQARLKKVGSKVDREAKDRRQRAIDYAVEEASENKMAFIAKLEREGDYRQARIHREALLTIREQVEQQYS